MMGWTIVYLLLHMVSCVLDKPTGLYTRMQTPSTYRDRDRIFLEGAENISNIRSTAPVCAYMLGGGKLQNRVSRYPR